MLRWERLIINYIFHILSFLCRAGNTITRPADLTLIAPCCCCFCRRCFDFLFTFMPTDAKKCIKYTGCILSKKRRYGFIFWWYVDRNAMWHKPFPVEESRWTVLCQTSCMFFVLFIFQHALVIDVGGDAVRRLTHLARAAFTWSAAIPRSHSDISWRVICTFFHTRRTDGERLKLHTYCTVRLHKEEKWIVFLALCLATFVRVSCKVRS